MRQGRALSPLLFLLVINYLSRKMREAKENELITWIKVSRQHAITHLMFFDDLFFGGESSIGEWINIQIIIKYFGIAT